MKGILSGKLNSLGGRDANDKLSLLYTSFQGSENMSTRNSWKKTLTPQQNIFINYFIINWASETLWKLLLSQKVIAIITYFGLKNDALIIISR